MNMWNATIAGLLVALLPLAAPGALAEDLSKDAERLLESARRMAKAPRFDERQEELLAKKADGVGTGDLERVVDLLAAEPEGKAKAGVVGWLARRVLAAKYGEPAAEKIEGLYDLRRTADPAKLTGLLSSSLMLPDLRLANEVAVRAAGSESREVRLRAAIALSELIGLKAAEPAAEKTFGALFGDVDPAVRAVAIRRGFEVRFDPAFDLGVARLNDAAKGAADVRGRTEDLCPGAEALGALNALTGVEPEMTFREYVAADAAAKEALRESFRTWWSGKGKAFPPPGFREAPFAARPSVTETATVPPDGTSATLTFWAGADRTRVRILLDEIQLAATSRTDWRVNFHLRYMASGMRPDDGEAYPREVFMGTPFVLARKNIGCFVLVFQRLLDGQLVVRLDFHDPAR